MTATPQVRRRPARPPHAHDRLLHQRAVEAVLWSMPVLSDMFFRESLARDLGMVPGDVVVMSRPLAARHQVLTASCQVNYACIAYDLSGGPLVIEVPASDGDYAIIGEICDNWQAPVTMVGAEGPDAGAGGRYLLLPPGWPGEVPAGFFEVPMQGYRGTMVFRPVVVGPEGTMEGAITLARKTRTWPLAELARPRPTRVIDGWDRSWHSLPVYDCSWFEKLARFVNDEPLRPRDRVMIGMLATLGIEKGRPFQPDARTRRLLEAAIQDAFQIMQQGFLTPGQALVPWWQDSQWMNMNPELFRKTGQDWSFETAGGVWTYERAIAPFFWANYLPRHLGGGQLNLMGLRDTLGELLSGQRTYRLRVPADVPVEKSWSLIMYSLETKSFIPNPLDRAGIDSCAKSKLRRNADGSVDIFAGDKVPRGYEANWLPSAGRDFFLVFRFYGPGAPVFDKTWRLPGIEILDYSVG